MSGDDWKRPPDWDYGQNVEESIDPRTGKVIGRYSSGPLGKSHATRSDLGKGRTTLHRDRNNHHHGAHIPSSGNAYNFDGQERRKQKKFKLPKINKNVPYWK